MSVGRLALVLFLLIPIVYSFALRTSKCVPAFVRSIYFSRYGGFGEAILHLHEVGLD